METLFREQYLGESHEKPVSDLFQPQFGQLRPFPTSNWSSPTTNSSSDDFYESYEALPEKSIEKDDVLFTNLIVYPDFDLSIELYLYPNHDWVNVFGFGVAGMISYIKGIGFADGNRVPAVWLGKNDTTLSVSFSINGNGNHVWQSEQPMPTEKWFKLQIKQELIEDFRYMYKVSSTVSLSTDSTVPKFSTTNVFQIIIDDQTMYSIVNNQTQTYRNVKAAMGNSYKNHKNPLWLRKYFTAKGKYRNLIFKSGKNKIT